MKTSRNTLSSRNTSPRAQLHSYSERWDLAHLVKDPVQRFEALVGEIETMVAQFESARAHLSPTMATSIFHTLLTLSEDIAAASSRLSAYAYLWFSEIRDASGGGGADLIIDPVWGEPALAALKAAAPGARLVQIGNMAGVTAELAAPIMRANKVDVLGHAVFHAPVEVRREGYLRRICRARRHHGVPGSDAARRRCERLGKATRAGAGTKLVLVP